MKKLFGLYKSFLNIAMFLAVFVFFQGISALAEQADTTPDFPVLVISKDTDAHGNGSGFVDLVINNLRGQNITVETAVSVEDALQRMTARKNIGAILLDNDLFLSTDVTMNDTSLAIDGIRSMNDKVPVFLMTGHSQLATLPPEIFKQLDGYIRKNEDTPAFIAGSIRYAARSYREQALPPFFRALVDYVGDCKYAWSTPGHAGGLGFLSSVPGAAFFEFFGENIFRADLSSSMPELGSILEHEGPAGAAEKEAAIIFGADYTFFVLNGTSTSNKMVWHSLVTAGDIVLVDRNCHKSIMHAIIMTDGTPAYLVPTRNRFGIIGPIHLASFEKEAIAKALERSKLASASTDKKIRLVVVTNSTYDGLCYYVAGIKDRVSGLVENIHFDEAWYGYACSHPLYAGRFGMSTKGEKANHPPTYATQSTHKLLAAFSQGSMIHIKNGGEVKVDPERFNEAFLMHESTSPFYPMFASIDVSAKMMSGASGRRIMDAAIREAIEFRKKMAQIANNQAKGWWFRPWQPIRIGDKAFEDIETEKLMNDTSFWILKKDADWHGFQNVEDDQIMLDPIKVTLLTPGIKPDGIMAEDGIPAGIVSEYLRENGVIPEKTGHYNILFLFAPGVTEGKSGTLIAKLSAFKELYDRNAPIEEIFPDIVRQYPDQYTGVHIQDLCSNMHRFLKDRKLTDLMIKVYENLPEQAVSPAEAYRQLVRGNVEYVDIKNLQDRTTAVMVVPYPPGIPVIMPGEQFSANTKETLDYLTMCQEFDNKFPGFETEIHGIDIEKENGQRKYRVNCIKK